MNPIAILKKYFGYREGQGIADFAKEIKALSPEERDWFVSEAAKQLGVDITA